LLTKKQINWIRHFNSSGDAQQQQQQQVGSILDEKRLMSDVFGSKIVTYNAIS
jgi:hypothetical protein